MILKRLTDAAQQRVAELQKIKSFAMVRSEAEARKFPSHSFKQSLMKNEMSIIAEVKKASPSKGIIAEKFNYLEIAKAYEAGGAAAISCLTEPQYFLGKDEYLTQIAEVVSLPVLRKDFTVSEYQIYEAKVIGASAILLICSILSASQLQEYLAIAESIGLDALVETHDEREVETALLANANIIGVNNRNLKDFTVDLETSIRLRHLVPQDKIFVSESGIRNVQDINRLKSHKVNAVLIGETLMKSENIALSLKELLGAENA